MKRFTFYAFHMAMLTYAVLLVILALPIWGQKFQPIQQSNSVSDFEIQSLDKRISTIEALNLDRRLTVIETLLKDVNGGQIWSQLSMGGVGLILAREVIKVLQARNREE